MRNCYISQVGEKYEVAIADLCDYYDQGLIITRISVPARHQGKGHGKALLERIIKDADEAHVTLWLEILPSGRMTYEELRDWYKRHGFRDLGGVFRRLPR